MISIGTIGQFRCIIQVALPIPIQPHLDSDARDGHFDESPDAQAAIDRRKDKWRTSSSKFFYSNLKAVMGSQ